MTSNRSVSGGLVVGVGLGVAEDLSLYRYCSYLQDESTRDVKSLEGLKKEDKWKECPNSEWNSAGLLRI